MKELESAETLSSFIFATGGSVWGKL
jgi:hypothetical protein